MKTRVLIGMTLASMIVFSGCSDNSNVENISSEPVSSIVQEDQTEVVENNNEVQENQAEVVEKTQQNLPKVETKNEKVDLDITEKMYITYINEIYTNPESYLGKKLKIEGMFTNEHSDATNLDYRYVYRVGPGCCGNDGSMCGFEFTTSDNKYPNENEWIEVIGTLDQYDEYGTQYLTIRADSVTVKTERGAESVLQ